MGRCLIAYLDKRTLKSKRAKHVTPPSSSPFPVKQLSAISGQHQNFV
jgi:hypothetical protein